MENPVGKHCRPYSDTALCDILSGSALFVYEPTALDKKEYLLVIFLFLIETICCELSSEPSHQNDSDEGSKHMFL